MRWAKSERTPTVSFNLLLIWLVDTRQFILTCENMIVFALRSKECTLGGAFIAALNSILGVCMPVVYTFFKQKHFDNLHPNRLNC
mmetsp:Transcript_4336/g.6431  ORF Transcript_4336/g.6431 Transcript_4336/m.6431 type:complete len:85 (-) Transcript_4336:93-347(-)